MTAVGDYHHIECPFSRPGYFTGVAAILGDTTTLIDAGTAASPKEAIFPFLESVNREADEISDIVLTHGHGDHFDGVPIILRASNAKVHVHRLDKPAVLDLAARTSFDPSRVEAVKHNDVLTVSNREIEVFHTPGHTAGSICLIDRNLRLCITGDSVQGKGAGRPLLFYSSIAYADSMRRLSLEPIEILMMGHPFPPFEQGVIRKGKVKAILQESMRALEDLKNKVMKLLETNRRPLTMDEICNGLPEAREPSIEPILEELSEEGKVWRIGKDDELLWLYRQP
ncbi:MAG: MBL fold metallo-hydrolase [Candidatus Bathyarchaeota archaeon]|nr:MBL fold metallo-hydrolase [Candidatus Bathyarchaeota archaeon]